MRKIFTLIILLASLNLFFSECIFANSLFGYSIDTKEQINIYPNPRVDNATIKISDDINLQDNKVSVVFYNIVGKEIFKISQVKDYQINISKDNFKTSGMFFYQLKVEDKLLATGKVIVK